MNPKILFINPCVRPDTPKKIINVGLAYVVSAVQRAGYEFQILDIDAHRYSNGYVTEYFQKNQFDVVAVGTLVSMYAEMKELAALIRRCNEKTLLVAGNTLATSIPETLLRLTDFDIVVLGEGEAATQELLGAIKNKTELRAVKGIGFLENGEYIKTPSQDLSPDLDKIEIPNYELFDLDVYLDASKHHVPAPHKLPIGFEDLKAFPINTARGCPFRCTFCFHAFQGLKYRTRSPKNIVAEIALLKEKYGINFVNFWDELTWASPRDAEEFCDELIKQKLEVHWIASCRSELLVRKAGGERIASKMKEAGCHGLAFSLESGSPRILDSMKKLNTVEEFIEQSNLLFDQEIDVFSSIIIGYPEECPDTIDETFEVMERAKAYPSVGFLQLMPGTPMYELGKTMGKIEDDESYLIKMGDRQDLRINLTSYDDEFLMNYTTEKLNQLSQKFGMGLDDSELIKSKTWRGSTKVRHDNFVEDFGISGSVLKASNFS